MQKEMSVLENEPFQFRILADWDTESAVHFTERLYQYASVGKFLLN